MSVEIGTSTDPSVIETNLLSEVSKVNRSKLANFIYQLYLLYVDLHFTYLEINPLVVKEDGIYVLDLAAKLDQTADYICHGKWGRIEFPPPFGREAYPEVIYFKALLLYLQNVCLMIEDFVVLLR